MVEVLFIPRKYCPVCEQLKLRRDFHKDITCSDGYAGSCKVCLNKRKSIRRKELKATLSGHFTQMLNWVRKRAKSKNKEFSITFNDMIELYGKQQGLCALSKLPLKYGDRPRGDFETLSIDCIDSKKGYTIDNVQLVCNGVNTMKLSLSQGDFIVLCKRIASNFPDSA